jgi:hypothetical protein
MGLFSWLKSLLPKRRITYIEQLVRDENPRFLHLFCVHTVMPDEGESFHIYVHHLFDTERKMITVGEKQRGESLQLDSPFVTRSMEKLSQAMKTILSLKRNEDDDEENDSSSKYETNPRPKVLLRDGKATDTEKPKSPPKDGLLFTDYGDDSCKFTLEIFRTGRCIASHNMTGRPDYFFKKVWLAEKEQLIFTYRKGGWAMGGMAIAVVNFRNGELMMDEYLPFS